MWRLSILALIAALALAVPAAASAQTIPPDSSAVGQYTENVPGAGGDKPSNGGDGGSGSDGAGEALPPDAEGALDSLANEGPDGAAAAGLARAGAEIPTSDKAKTHEGGSDGAKGGGSIPGDLFGQVPGSDSGGMGIALPILLGASAVAALLVGLARLRGWPERSMHP